MTAATLPAAYRLLRTDAQRLLHTWQAPSPQQERLRTGILEHLDRHPDGMWKQGPPAHVTASALVLNPALDRVLLTLHTKAGLWLQFGGHLEAEDVSVHAAATREAREESGVADVELLPRLVHLDWHRLIAEGFKRCTEHLDLRFAGVVPDQTAYAVSDESVDVRWWPVDDLPPESRNEILPLALAARVALG